ncbi:hypothetical protein BDZ85DRAFT_321882 [Elsinoe ampelina]|uniref:rRNA adenine N(6)-methyltransferase n=1 Tax=Elsinoe ampelina TaxID=302913 RepID=A0A6A6G2H8_9PEZI|nr:hypothetical protein BDZ85DRAFT_321882 [Elsinoe ampelina]
MGKYGSPKTFFQAASKYPISKVLAKQFANRITVISGGVRSHARSDIVSPELCDDALGYIGANLEDYHGCDIIDVNPGACLWSQKIHDLLKPRTHILIEPEPRYFKPFIKPLLSKDETYKFSDLHGSHLLRYWSTYERIFNDGLLPPRTPLPKNDPALRKFNRTLLVTGNLHRFYVVDGFKKAGVVNSFTTTLGHFIHSAQNNTMFHQYGLVKLLLWGPDEARQHTLPWLVQARTTMSASADLVANISEVAGSSLYLDDSQNEKRATLIERPRPLSLEWLSSFWTSKRMQESGITMPAGRKPQIAVETEGISSNSIQDLIQNMNINVKNPPEHDTLKKHEKSVRALLKASKTFKDDDRTFAELKKERISNENKYIFDKKLYHPIPIPSQNRFATFMRLGKRQVEAEAAFWQHYPSMPLKTRASVEEGLMQSAANIRDGIHGKNTLEFKMHAERFRIAFDEQRCLFLDEPVLAFDRRPHEPLATRPDEFWPNIPLMLLEIDPLERNFASDITSREEGTAVMRSFILGLYQRKGTSLWDGLNSFCPGLAEDMYEAVPELRNPRHGGRLDPKDLRIFALPRNLLEKLVVAYLEWPFRPSEHEILNRLAVDEAESEEAGSEQDAVEEE